MKTELPPLLNLPDPRHVWVRTVPFRHIALLVMPDWTASTIAAEFPAPDAPGWHTFGGPLEYGKQEGTADIAGPYVAKIHAEYETRMTYWLRHVFEIPDLTADPFRVGSGIHQTGPGGRLALHTDFNVHPDNPTMIRAVNAILFLTDTHGEGKFMLRNPRTGTDAEINPTPGCLVAFECSDEGFHGHPVPMAEGAPLRRTIPGYWYRPPREGEEIEAHSTRFLEDA